MRIKVRRYSWELRFRSVSHGLAVARVLDHFSALRDPGQRWRVVYPLPEILLLGLCATLFGMKDFLETRLWGGQRLDVLRRFLPYERGIPGARYAERCRQRPRS